MLHNCCPHTIANGAKITKFQTTLNWGLSGGDSIGGLGPHWPAWQSVDVANAGSHGQSSYFGAFANAAFARLAAAAGIAWPPEAKFAAKPQRTAQLMGHVRLRDPAPVLRGRQGRCDRSVLQAQQTKAFKRWYARVWLPGGT
eukprot:352231-Chlamydomonas_euryale.AAC.11